MMLRALFTPGRCAAVARQALRAPTLAPKRALSDTPNLKYSERMDKTGRPISPHIFGEAAPAPSVSGLLSGQVGIYKIPAIAWSSIAVRVTGVLASAGFFVLGGGVLVGGSDWAVDTAQRISEAVSPAATKFAVAFVLSYQWFGSARHAYWDKTAKGFNNTTMLHSSYAMVATTLGLSLGLACLALPPFEKKKSDKK